MRLLYFFHTPQPKMRHRYSILLASTIHARTGSYKSATFKIMCHIIDMVFPSDLGTAITLSLFANNQEMNKGSLLRINLTWEASGPL